MYRRPFICQGRNQFYYMGRKMLVSFRQGSVTSQYCPPHYSNLLISTRLYGYLAIFIKIKKAHMFCTSHSTLEVYPTDILVPI